MHTEKTYRMSAFARGALSLIFFGGVFASSHFLHDWIAGGDGGYGSSFDGKLLAPRGCVRVTMLFPHENRFEGKLLAPRRCSCGLSYV